LPDPALRAGLGQNPSRGAEAISSQLDIETTNERSARENVSP
jgi:hypothetical protein